MEEIKKENHQERKKENEESQTSSQVAVYYLCNSQDTDIWTGGGGSVSCPKNAVQHTGNALYKYSPNEPEQKHHGHVCVMPAVKSCSQSFKDNGSSSPIDGVDRRWRSAGEASAGVVVADRLDDAGHHGAHHADHTCSRDGGSPPLDCRRGGTERIRDPPTTECDASHV